LLFLSWGPLQVIADEFATVDGAEQALIFGSWAARYHQRHGPPPHDLDVLAVGNPPGRLSTMQPTEPSSDWVCLSTR
jgi:hypothetical protein